MKHKGTGFNTEAAANLTKDAFIAEHTGSHAGVTDADLAEIHGKCCEKHPDIVADAKAKAKAKEAKAPEAKK